MMTLPAFDTQPWDYRDTCPCDMQFRQWLIDDHRNNLTILHMGTGTHHLVGQWAHEHDSYVLGITASWGEYEAYRDLVAIDPSLQEHYQVLYTNIYALPCILLPEFDVISLPHIGEFPDAETITNFQLVDDLAAHVKPGGRMIFYTASSGWGRVHPDVREVIALHSKETYMDLLIYRVS